MPDSVSILENYSDKSLAEIALCVAAKIVKTAPEILLKNCNNLSLGVNFLDIPEPYDSTTWDEMEIAFQDFPDTCFCVSINEEDTQYRVLFFNGKAVTQYPEIRYPEFRPNDFEYEASKKEPLPIIQGKLLPTVTRPPLFLEEATEPDPVALDFIRKSLFGDIIMENRQDA